MIALYINGSCTIDFCGRNLMTLYEWLKSHISQNDDCTSWVQVQEPEWTHKLDMTSRELSSVVDWLDLINYQRL